MGDEAQSSKFLTKAGDEDGFGVTDPDRPRVIGVDYHPNGAEQGRESSRLDAIFSRRKHTYN